MNEPAGEGLLLGSGSGSGSGSGRRSVRGGRAQEKAMEQPVLASVCFSSGWSVLHHGVETKAAQALMNGSMMYL